MNSYFSDREGPTRPRTVETINGQTWRGILSLIQARISDGSLGLGFPLQCQDGGAICGTDEASLWDRAIAEIPRLVANAEGYEEEYSWTWRPRTNELPPTDAILDLCELITRSIGQPIAVSHHGYFQHDHLRHNQEAGFTAWVSDVNTLLARSGLIYEMAEDGSIKRLLPTPLLEIVAQTEFSTGDTDTDALLGRAVTLLTSRGSDAHQDAIEKLWDAFERIKTLEPGDKKQSADALLKAAEAPNAPMFNQIVRDEFRALTELGNKHRIRHSETSKEPISSRREAEYLFHRMFALLRYVLLQTNRIRRA